MRQIIFILMVLASGEILAAERAGLLVYEVWEPYMGPYISRVLVNARYLRLDEGGDEDDFTLFDRERAVIFNVSNEDETVLLMQPSGGDSASVPKLELTEKIETDHQAPQVAGKQPRKVTLFTNGQLCRELVTIEGAMDEALTALAEFQQVLAKFQLSTLTGQVPQICEQSELLYASDRALKFGLPLIDSYMGKRQMLVDYKPSYEVTAGVFSVPASYREITMPGLSVE